MITPIHVAAIALALAAPVPAAAGAVKTPAHATQQAVELNADGTVPDKEVSAGKETPVAVVWDCALPTLAPVVSARVEHGSVAIRTGNGSRCGHSAMSLTEVLYRSEPGFRGTDTLHILGFLTHGDLDQTFTILVK